MYLITTKFSEVKTRTFQGLITVLHVWGYYTSPKMLNTIKKTGFWEDEDQYLIIEKLPANQVKDVEYAFA